VLADGSEYRGDYGLSRSRLRDFHRQRLELLLEAGPDMLAVETVPDVREAEALAGLLAELAVPAWFSFSVDGTHTRAGQPVREALQVADAVEAVLAVGVNCCRPEDVLPCLRIAREVTGKSLVAYPNSGESWDPSARRWAGGSRFDASLARGWVEAGASYVGGCCRVGPRDIAALAAVVRAV
jgi:homocysteine S-methyltransferase